MPYVSNYFSPSRDPVREIMGFIRRCETHLDVAVYSLTHDEITAEIIAAHQRGVILRVLTDKVQASSQYADDEKLEEAGIQVRRDRHAGSMHAKYCIEPNAVGLGSHNWTRSAETRNIEHWSIIRLKYVVRQYQDHFDMIWELNVPE
jgi:phosphatidylserine/phosphatidylglycerophosphate/cardiolipin synthase-like enzyme